MVSSVLGGFVFCRVRIARMISFARKHLVESYLCLNHEQRGQDARLGMMRKPE